MQKRKISIMFFILLLFAITSLTGCSRPIPTMDDVTGKWVAVKKENYALGSGELVGFVIQFLSDKTVMLPSGKGKWNILDDGRLQIEIPGMTMYGELDKDILTVTMPKDKGKVIFKKQSSGAK